jgi:hypothetical protein
MESFRFKIERTALFGLIPLALAFHLPSTSGPFFFISFGMILLSFLFFLRYLKWFFSRFERKQGVINNLMLLTASLTAGCILIESFLSAYDSKSQKSSNILIPKEWKRRSVSVAGASFAYYWHNILHVHDRNHMRRTSPFPPKSRDRFRVMVVGDSLTYGYGVREEETYPKQIETILKKNFNVEVLNLGVSGYQSEDVLKIVKKFVPLLRPDLIIYGVCLNDFLPSGVGQYENNLAYSFPIPGAVKNFLSEKTHLGRLMGEAYNDGLMKLGFRNDFYTDILEDFKNYQTRFARDVKDMNMFALDRELPPIIAMVLNQYPELHSKGYQIAMAAERHLANAGMTVIPTEEFYKKYNGQSMAVSRWEGHPNTKAHKIFADFIAARLQDRSDLNKYRITK